MQNLKILAVILTMLLTFPGFSTAAPAESAHPVLQRIQVTGTGNDTRIEIVADKPLTYTYYKMPDLLKVVIDLALVEPGQVATFTVNSDLISKITVEKKAISNFSLTRVVINLIKDAEFAVLTYPADKSKLQVSFDKTPPSADKKTSNKTGEDKAPAAMVAIAPAAEAVLPPPAAVEPATAGEKQESGWENATSDISAVVNKETQTEQATALQRAESGTIAPKPILQPVVPQKVPSGSISTVQVNRDNLLIVTNSRVADYKAFTLNNPSRLVVDVSRTKCSIPAKDMQVKRFGVTKARVGVYPDKVRLVFDAEGKLFPPYKIANTDKGLVIKFPSWH